MTTPGFRLGVRLAAAGLLLALPTAASAACDVTVQGVAFGSYDPLSPVPLTGVGNVHVSCGLLTPIVIVSLGPGGGTFAQRRMTAGASQLSYNLYRDAARQFVWGQGSASVTSAVVLNLNLPVYGRIPALQNVPPNIYVDSISVTIDF